MKVGAPLLFAKAVLDQEPDLSVHNAAIQSCFRG